MLLSKTVKMKWNSKNKSRFIEFGYEFTKMKDTFDVDVYHLSNGSQAIVDVQCDYCGNVYQKHWSNYILENENSYIHKDCCVNCRKYKIQDVAIEKYGVKSIFFS